MPDKIIAGATSAKMPSNPDCMVSLLLAFSTMIWAYSNTSLNVVPACFFLLLGYLFFKKFYRLKQNKFLLLSSASLGFAFLVRHDVILFIIPLWLFLLVNILKRNSKINSLLFYSAPLAFSYVVHKIVVYLKYIPSDEVVDAIGTKGDVASTVGSELGSFIPGAAGIYHILTGAFGLLFAPGVGLFIFAPILLTVFFSFPDLSILLIFLFPHFSSGADPPELGMISDFSDSADDSFTLVAAGFFAIAFVLGVDAFSEVAEVFTFAFAVGAAFLVTVLPLGAFGFATAVFTAVLLDLVADFFAVLLVATIFSVAIIISTVP